MLDTRQLALIAPAVLALAAVGWAQAPATGPADERGQLVAADPNAGAPPVRDPNSADPNASGGGKNGGGGGGLFGGNMWFLVVMIGALVLMMLWSGRARRKQESKKRQMLEAMKKGDKVATIGGIVGTIIEVKGNEVVLKVDEQNNIRMRFLRSAIHHIGDVPSAEKEQSK
ncbi:MAG TPA: preprotein translocase subunit YajC [Phycisphaerae bacterium]|nr:preprotein translocase subunit YajC [Phycisphaerae bacterium]HUT57899.1 preprotein translocase subunit YajC [Phycisphaerae bacterium]